MSDTVDWSAPIGPSPSPPPVPPDSEASPTPADLDTCLRVLRHAAGDPLDPRWAAVHTAAATLYRADKKHRKARRRAESTRRDRELLAETERFRCQDPDATPAAPGPALEEPRPLLGTMRQCYVCKAPYREVSPDYHMLCPGCARENRERRHARVSLAGRRAVVTGGRVKIGFHTAVKLLRDGAEVIVTTRFPRDAARRFAALPDAADWVGRLHVYGVDFLDLAAVAGLLDMLNRQFDHLDILVNNAAQTIRRPAAYHRVVRAAEAEPLTGAAAQVDVADAPPALSGHALEAASPGGGPAVPSQAAEAEGALAALFPAGRTDETGQPLDLRDHNSWRLRLHEVEPAEWVECHVVNAFVPFLLTSRLRGPLEASPFPDRYVVQVSAMEGSFSQRHKTTRHPHTNMAKAGLNMLTRTAARDYAGSGIHMNSVDTGWVTDENPHPVKAAQRAAGFRPPLDVVDGAARVYDPIVRGVRGDPVFGLFLKDYRPREW